ncbi:MAG: MarR family winged helix-turn-helix transcriptional regulator, partial [Rhodospirillales bacterium]|nr:MarR family winged helix-turn-helix transcriptional regulator [Rhodospirillales bacterium]
TLNAREKGVYTYIMSAKPPSQLDVATAAVIGRSCLFLGLRRADRAAMQIYDKALRPCGLRATQFGLLVALRVLAPVSVSELAAQTVMDRTTLTRNLAPLERGGLVRVAPGKDRRVRMVSLTARGQRALARAYPSWRDAQTRARSLLGKKLSKSLVAQLHAAVQALASD